MNAALRAIWLDLGIAESVLVAKQLRIYAEADSLVEFVDNERVWLLIPAAANAWQAMQVAAAQDGIALQIISAYRSTERQVELIQYKLNAGQSIDAILQVLAPPGCSEHHTGRAVDVHTPGGEMANEAFEQTPAYAWLLVNAGRFGFTLSFPRDNPFGYVFEPWHWCYQPT
ncbi:M15 family metallopeptidase [Andreprevotia chitinilytica]|uniref:M15 family metallopeptidase n=1 Tax=Andreprevotia chitinilytica TaxID=396808 RepID=UPI0005521FF4|nr:M15 family metallopeptidase [Andreprevotia chitinilytica]